MSPRVLKQGDLLFWFHSHDVQHESRASIHVGKGSQNDNADAKIWLEPRVVIARPGRTLSQAELNRAIRIVQGNLERLQEAWNAHKRQAG